MRVLLCVAVSVCASAVISAAQETGNTTEGQQQPAVETEQFDVVEDRTRSFTADEQALLLRLLADSANMPFSERQAAARKLVHDRRVKISGFPDRSDSEFLTEDLLRSTDFYRGKLLEFRGYTRGVTPLKNESGQEGVEQYYRMTLYVEEGDAGPVEVYFRSLPKDWPEDADLIDDISVVGRFVKLLEYVDQESGRPATKPVIVAERIESLPKIEAGNVVIDPALWTDVVRHKTRGWTDAERDLYYRILHHAREGEYQAQRKQAKKSLLSRIEQYRTDAYTKRDEMHTRAKRLLESHPDDEAAYQRQLDAADQQLRQALTMFERYRDDPKLFPTYADIVINDHTAYNGKLVTLSGRVRDITKSPVDDKIRFDLGTLYELWFYTEDSQNHPTVAFCTSLPPGLMEKTRDEGERLDEPISVTGYFFKLHVYKAQDTDRFAPMLLAKEVEWNVAAAKREPKSEAYMLPFIALIVVGVGYFFWKTRVEDREFRQQLATVDTPETELALDKIEADPALIQPSFDQIEAAEEPHFRDHEDRGEPKEAADKDE